jgi:hypothetical protein
VATNEGVFITQITIPSPLQLYPFREDALVRLDSVACSGNSNACGLWASGFSTEEHFM